MSAGASPQVEILVDDCRTALRALPAESVQCVVTSPPYWGLRDYGVSGQIGLEQSVAEHIEALVDVFRDVRRVLRKDGTLWLNYGDAYASGVNGRSAADTKALGNDDRTFRDKPMSTVGPVNRRGASGNLGNAAADIARRNKAGPISKPRVTQHAEREDVDVGGWGKSDASRRLFVNEGYLKPKDLIGLPWRLAFALQADGWYLRSCIIWHKPNPMPESTRDRPTTAHEYVFLLSRSARYYYDADAIRTDLAPNSVARLAQDVDSQEGSERANGGTKTNGNMKAVGGNRARYKMPDGWDTGEGGHQTIHREGRQKGAPPDRGKRDHLSGSTRDDEAAAAPLGANSRSVWTIPTESFRESHFATFPRELARRCILAGSPTKVCSKCGSPWLRQTRVTYVEAGAGNNNMKHKGGDIDVAHAAMSKRPYETLMLKKVETSGFKPSCECQAPAAAATVLDPFGGAGTTGLVAAKTLRRALLIELNPDYAAIAHRRLKADLIAVAGGDPTRGLELTPLEAAAA